MLSSNSRIAKAFMNCELKELWNVDETSKDPQKKVQNLVSLQISKYHCGKFFKYHLLHAMFSATSRLLQSFILLT